MFGSGGAGGGFSFGSNNNNTGPNQGSNAGFGNTAGGNAFGQPGGFGSAQNQGNTFGATQMNNGGFGAQTTGQGAGFGTTTSSSGFGGFGSSTAAKPTLFGGNTGTSSVGGFGNSGQRTGSGFGFGGGTNNATSSQQSSGFGFGASNTTAKPSLFGNPTGGTGVGGFGSTNTASGVYGSTGATSATVNQGTGNPPYTTTTDIENGVSIRWTAITAMPAYRNFSFEELRSADYAANRKFPQAFGSSTTTGFGSTANTSGFGNNNNNNNNNSNTTTSGGFGFGAQNNTQQSTGMFGSQAQQQTNSFGATNNNAGFSGSSTTTPFGQNNMQGGFGASNTTNSLFGNNNNNNANTSNAGGFGFGANNNTGSQQQDQSKPFSFGGSANQTSLFGQPQQQQTGGLFGQSQPQQGATNGGFNFGASNAAPPATGAFGTANTGGLFGANKPATAPTTGTFSFGNSTAGTTANLFGAKPPDNAGGFGAQGTGASSLFGNNNNNAGNTGAGGFSFGAGAAKPAGGFSFGAAAPATTTSTANNGAFGTTPAAGNAGSGGGMFGAASTGAQPAATGGFSFGAPTTTAGNTGASTGGLFGNANVGNKPGGFSFGSSTGTNSLFGNNNTNSNNPLGASGATSLWGNTPAAGTTASGGGLFGNAGSNNAAGGTTAGATGGGLFGFGNNMGSGALTGGNGTQSTALGGGGIGGLSFGGGGLGGTNATGNSGYRVAAQFPLVDQPYGAQPHLETIAASAAQAAGKGISSMPLFVPDNAGNGTGANDNLRKLKTTLASGMHRITPRPTSKLNPRGFSQMYDDSSSAAASSGLYSNHQHASLLGTGSGAQAYNTATSTYGANLLSTVKTARSIKRLDLNSSAVHSSAHSNPPILLSNASQLTSPEPPRTPFVDRERLSESVFTPHRNSHNNNGIPEMSYGNSEPSSPRDNTMDGHQQHHHRNGSTSQSLTRSRTPSHHRQTSTSGTAATATAAAAVSSSEGGAYYTKPDWESVKRQNYKNIARFEVGRSGIGSVVWQGPLDLSEFATEEYESGIAGKIITFAPKECVVYPNESIKPRRGEGLNRPAEIRLHGCWPVDKSTRQPDKDPQSPRVSQWRARLQKRPDTSFVDYDPSPGIWTFRVEHFTKYGVESDDDESDNNDDDNEMEMDDENENLSRKHQSSKNGYGDTENSATSAAATGNSDREVQHARGEAAPVSPGKDFPGESETQKVFSPQYEVYKIKSQMFGAFFSDTLSQTSQQQQQFSQNTQNMLSQTSSQYKNALLFANDTVDSNFTSNTNDDAMSDNQDYYYDDDGDNNTFVSEADDFNSAVDAEDEQDEVDAVTAADMQSLEQDSYFAHEVAADVTGKTRFVAYKNSVAHGQDGQVHSAKLAFARMSRASWISSGILANANHAKAKIYRSEVRGASISGTEEMLQCILRHTDIRSDDGDNLPRISTDYISFATVAQLPYVKNIASPEERSTWDLGAALFDDLDPTNSITSSDPQHARYVNDMNRKHLVSQWLERTLLPEIETEVKGLIAQKQIEEAIFVRLCGHNVFGACELALRVGWGRLATLMAQLGGNGVGGLETESRHDIKRQIEVWERDGFVSRKMIHPVYLRIYHLLSGEVEHVCGDLEWKRALGLYLWYKSFAEMTIEDVFTLHQDDVFGRATAHPRNVPLPQYLTSALNGRGETEPNDLRWHLLRLYTDRNVSLETMLRANTHLGSSADCSVRIGWMMYMLLKGHRVRNLRSQASTCKLHVTFAAELEKVGLWPWSIFILLYNASMDEQNSFLRRCAFSGIQEIILRNFPETKDDEVSRTMVGLLEAFLIPPAALHFANGLTLMYHEEHANAVLSLLDGGEISTALTLANDKIMPGLVLDNKFEQLEDLYLARFGAHASRMQGCGASMVSIYKMVVAFLRMRKLRSLEEKSQQCSTIMKLLQDLQCSTFAKRSSEHAMALYVIRSMCLRAAGNNMRYEPNFKDGSTNDKLIFVRALVDSI